MALLRGRESSADFINVSSKLLKNFVFNKLEFFQNQKNLEIKLLLNYKNKKMEPQWAGENQLEERPLLSKRAEEKLKRRKEIIEQKLHQKRISSTQKKELFTTKVIPAQEVIN